MFNGRMIISYDSLLKVHFSVCQPASSSNFDGNFCSLFGLRNISVIIVESEGLFCFVLF